MHFLVFSHFVINSLFSFQKEKNKTKSFLEYLDCLCEMGSSVLHETSTVDLSALSWHTISNLHFKAGLVFTTLARHHELHLLFKGASNMAYISGVSVRLLCSSSDMAGLFSGL